MVSTLNEIARLRGVIDREFRLIIVIIESEEWDVTKPTLTGLN